MRKFLAALLAVLMLAAIAVLPLAAEEAVVDKTKSEIDGTTVADAEALSLIVTEYMSNTTCSNTVVGQDVSTKNAYQYIELYNRGTTDVNLYDLAIVRAANRLNSDSWNAGRMFEAKLSLNPGSIYNDVAGVENNGTYSKHACVNPTTAMLKPGEFAIIWFWNDDSRNVSDALGKSLGADTLVSDGNGGHKTVYHKAFRDHYKTQNNIDISDDLLVVAVYAGSTADSTNNPRFNLNTSGSYMYALVKDEAAGANFDHKTEPAFTANKGAESTLFQYNEKIVCLWQWGVLTNLSIPSITPEGVSTIYVPANNVPNYYNATQREIEGDEYEDKVNFYDSKYVDGFKEVGLVSFQEKPTVGAMDAYQWVYVDPDRAPDAVKALAADGKTWQEVAIANYLAANVEVGEEDVENPEEERLPGGVHVDRGNLGNKGQNAADPGSTTGNNNGGLGIWLWVIIAGAAVVVLGGAAVVVIIVLKKKNKPVALDDVASDEAPQVIDENENGANE